MLNAATGSNEWQGDHPRIELTEPACRAIAALADRQSRHVNTTSPGVDIDRQQRAGDLTEALRPFAGVEEADLVGTTFQGKGDEEAVLYFHRTGKSITLGDFRRARAALAARKEDGNG
ncbi:hypothetical protein [Bordetella bronchiseptica]|uniref:Uncharacterized protein n=2 Tax=Bordetella bronchiseptica TaxID=518 RepID=A0ABR4R7D1_BORBO|nr:hypothetical protein [Bordetella bronchiseptica]KCV30791.1 hypothetical protein L490_1477 [Bordetella bronchiseptica 00-P-2796]